MRVILFCHSLLSDWNHGNAHFLRGLASELAERGHEVDAYEPMDGWSVQHLLQEPAGEAVLAEVSAVYPALRIHRYEWDSLDLRRTLEGADLVLVHEWNEPGLLARIGALKPSLGFRLLFHDTHHRAVSAPAQMAAFDLSRCDGVLAFGQAVRDVYLRKGWARRAWTFHEAADTRVFYPRPPSPKPQDLVWIGNWGDEERTQALHEFLLDPVQALGLRGKAHGVRYPQQGLEAIRRAGLQFAGWLPNHRVPQTFADAQVTVHIPRAPYAAALAGVPTIRVFEALACGIPLVCSPWEDTEGLFTPGRDFWVARDGAQMRTLLRELVHEPDARSALREHGLRTIRARHTCAHRAEQLLSICAELGLSTRPKAPPSAGVCA